MLRIGHHRRFTANHTMHADLGTHRLFIKLNPHLREAAEEVNGHVTIAGHYPVPVLHHRVGLGHWTALVYERHGDGRRDDGLLLAAIDHADLTGDLRLLDACLDAVIGHYRKVIDTTLANEPLASTVSKLYGERARTGGGSTPTTALTTRFFSCPTGPNCGPPICDEQPSSSTAGPALSTSSRCCVGSGTGSGPTGRSGQRSRKAIRPM